MHQAHQPFASVALFIVLVASVEIAVSGHNRDEPLVVTRFALEESRDVDRQFVEETYRGTLRHIGGPGSTDFARVTASIAHSFGLPAPGIAHVVDGDLAFGSVRAGETVDSVDTITIRRYRHLPLKPNQLRWDIDAQPDLVVPDDWVGRWRFVTTTKDAESGRVVLVSDITHDIGRGEPVGFSILPALVKCRGRGDGQTLDASCWMHSRFGACAIEGSAMFALERSNDIARGHGEWHGASTDCGPFSSRGGRTLAIEGQRLTHDATAQRLSIGLLQYFGTEPALVRLIARARGDDRHGEPSFHGVHGGPASWRSR